MRRSFGRSALSRARRYAAGALLLPALLAGCAAPAGDLSSSSQTVQEPQPEAPASVTVPILLYHDVSETGEGEYIISRENLLLHLDAIKEAGYHTVTFQQMADYVEQGVPLPDKPVALTFDDGYLSNYEIVWPALREREMTATIFVIGSSMGKDTYKDTGAGIIPHFSYEQAREMSDSGVISIQTHTYDMHQYQPLEPDGGRRGCLRKESEAPDAYRQALESDLTRAMEELTAGTGQPPLVLSYPGGDYTQECEEVSARLGLKASVSTVPQSALLVRGDPSSLRLMGRYNIDDCSVQELLELLEAASLPPEPSDTGDRSAP